MSELEAIRKGLADFERPCKTCEYHDGKGCRKWVCVPEEELIAKIKAEIKENVA